MPKEDCYQEKQEECQLYRHFDKDGRLLYVGISYSAMARFINGHKRGSAWFGQSASMTMENFPSRKLAMQAERRAIKTEKPLYNKAHAIDDEQNEMFKPDECGNELEHIPTNQVNETNDCLSNSIDNLKPIMWFLDLEPTGRTVQFQGTDYVQFRGVDCYGQLIAHHVAIGSKPNKWSRLNYLGPPVFFTYKAV